MPAEDQALHKQFGAKENLPKIILGSNKTPAKANIRSVNNTLQQIKSQRLRRTGILQAYRAMALS